jgi:hypothetical protein
MDEEMRQLAIKGIDCTNAEKYKHSGYRDYITERKKEQTETPLRERLLAELGIKEKLKVRTPLIHSRKKTIHKTIGQNGR